MQYLQQLAEQRDACQEEWERRRRMGMDLLGALGFARDKAHKLFLAYLHLDSDTAENVQDYQNNQANHSA